MPQITVDLAIENAYPDGVVNTVVSDASVEAPDSLETEAFDEWASAALFDFTGTGRTDGDAIYTVTITRSSDDRLVGRTVEFG